MIPRPPARSNLAPSILRSPILGGSILAGAMLVACGGSPENVATEASPAPPAGDTSRLVETYRAWDFSSCESAEKCAESFRERAGQPPSKNPKRAMKNPDPTWIPEWDSLPAGDDGTRYVYEALALAANNRSWAKRCDEAYAEYAKGLDVRMREVDDVVSKESRDPNPYDRLSALLALKPKSDPESPSEFTTGSDPARFEAESAIFDAFEATNRTFLYLVGHYAPSDAVQAVMHKREPRAYEHDAFCLDASRGLSSAIPKLPTLAPSADEVRAMVRPAIAPERVREIEKRRAELADLTRAKFKKADVDSPSLPPGVREMSQGRVQRFERNGKGATVVLLLLSEKTDASGKAQKIDETITADFADWPSGLVLDVGDALSFYGIEQKQKDTIIKSSPTLEHLSRETSVLAKHLSKATTKAKTFVYFAR